jgi:hypothetical protein
VYDILLGQANFIIINIKGPTWATCIANVKIAGSLHLSGRSCTISGNSTNMPILYSMSNNWEKEQE